MAKSPDCSRNQPTDPPGKIVHRASEPSLSNRWGVIHSTRANNNSRSDKSAEQRDARSIRRQTSHHTRPETHQNLIHSNKEQHDRSTGTADTNGATTPPGRFAQAHDQTEFEHPRYRPKSASLAQPPRPQTPTALMVCKQTIAAVRGHGGSPHLLCKRGWWRQSGSNR